jgi:glycogen debranching enzyme
MAALRELPFGLYYGSVVSTPLFVLLAGLYTERTGNDPTIAGLWAAIEAALNWIDVPPRRSSSKVQPKGGAAGGISARRSFCAWPGKGLSMFVLPVLASC